MFLKQNWLYNKIKIAVGQEQEQRRQTPVLTDKEQHYMRMLEEKQGLRNAEMTSSKVLNDNPEYGHYEGQNVGYNDTNHSQKDQHGCDNHQALSNAPHCTSPT